MRDAKHQISSHKQRTLQCAIYTRKSTDEGLDQEFNSLDAQREACAAYVLSQRHEGWTLSEDTYDDGGFSGGTLVRPGLSDLLEAVKAGRVDIIVVYKVDRLTRSLADFAKIVEILDAAGASFVSITQSFNTTTSMGRLTLNVLLSFAQFEREVISERVRDKVAASKAKGIWMGGPVALGYRVEGRKLLVDEEEAATVRDIMQRYLLVGSVRELMDTLIKTDIVTKVQPSRDGLTRGGIPFARGTLYHLLKNRIYLGEIVHKGTWYEGEHQAVVPQQLFDAVQRKLAASAGDQQRRFRATHVSLLTGMIRDGRGRVMSPKHAVKGDRRYRYYVSASGPDIGESLTDMDGLRLPAGDVDRAVRDAIVSSLRDGPALAGAAGRLSVSHSQRLIEYCRSAAALLAACTTVEARKLLLQMGTTAVIDTQHINISWDVGALLPDQSSLDLSNKPPPLSLSIPLRRVRYGNELKARVDPPLAAASNRDVKLVDVIVRAHAARDTLLGLSDRDETPVNTVRHLQRIARLSYLAPDLLVAILEGNQPARWSSRKLAKVAALPLAWDEQRRLLGLA